MTTIKKTTIYINLGEKTQVFQSPEDIPDSLRKKLLASTRGMNSATILIADRGGREEIRKVLRGESSALKSRLRNEYLRESVGDMAARTGEAVTDRLELSPATTDRRLGSNDWGWWQWGELLLPGAVGLALWLLFTWK